MIQRKSLIQMSTGELHKLLESEIDRIQERLLITGIPDPRLRVYPQLLKIGERIELIKAWWAFSAEDKH